MGSLFAALTTAVSGLNAQSSAIGNISDNLANAQTTGFKSIGTSFEDLVNSSSATVNNPGGVRATPQYQNDVQGSITTSNTTTNLGISGQGYFSVQTASTDASGNTTFNAQAFYTRAGDFTLDKNGFLVNGAGYYLDGWSVDSTGHVDQSATAPIQISALLNNPVPTKNVTYEANLPSNASVGFTSTASTLLVYDATGATHAVNYTWTKTGANAWSLNATVPSADDIYGNAYNATIPVTFNTSTNIGTVASITGYTAPTATTSSTPSPYVASSPQAAGDPANVTVSLNWGGGLAAQSVVLDFGEFGGSTGVTQFADSNSQVSVTNFNQDGLGRGSFNNLSINQDGLVSLNYSNGTNRTIAQVPIVQFFAQDQLQRVSGGAYTATLAAGNPRLGPPGVSGAGTIASSSLEQSNVDIATQFTNLIQAQQIYSANAKVVTTDNQLLQVTINMVQ